MISFEPRHFWEIEEFIHKFSGILLKRVPKKGVSERIKRHIESLGLRSGEEYLAMLKDPSTVHIRDDLISLVTVNESFFFRNPAQFRYLAKEIFPRLCEKKRKAGLKFMNIWSAACASGEEAYSLAYFCRMVKRNYPEIDFHILASDINIHSLQKAKEGLFRKRSFRAASSSILEEFQIPLGQESADAFEVDHELRNILEFRFINLRDYDRLSMFGKFDIIFCRNVLIYFDEQLKTEIVTKFNQLLNPEGILFLGETESLSPVPACFALTNCNGAFCYRRIPALEEGKND